VNPVIEVNPVKTALSQRTAALLLCAALAAALLSGCADDGTYSIYPYNPGDQFITNVSGQARTMLVSTIMIDVIVEKYLEALTEKNYIIRARIHQFLAEQDLATLNASGAMVSLGATLKEELNEALGHEYVYRVHLTYYTHG
jgi:flagellar basal body-associated protein FliL